MRSLRVYSFGILRFGSFGFIRRFQGVDIWFQQKVAHKQARVRATIGRGVRFAFFIYWGFGFRFADLAAESILWGLELKIELSKSMNYNSNSNPKSVKILGLT